MQVPIKGYEGLYFISDNGVVIPSVRQGTSGAPLKHQIMKNGYHKVWLRNKTAKKCAYIHRLVAEHFIQNPECKPCVNHIDGDKNNNNFHNLEWCSYSENMRHAILHNLNHLPRLCGEQHPQHKITADDVLEIRRLSKEGKNNRELSGMFHITEKQIRNIVLRKAWKSI